MNINKPFIKAKITNTATFFIAGAAATSGVEAQEQSANNNFIEEVVVTSQKREENAQDVPITLQTLTGDKLNEYNISNFDEYIEYLPNVTSGGRGPGQSTIYIRGMAVDPITVMLSGAQGSTPNVALYLDEQPVTSVGRNLDVYVADMERIEVLPGPQGTLYGASSQAGTVRLITNKPKFNELEGGMNVSSFATKGGDMSSSLDSFINIPIINDAWSVRGVFFNSSSGGYIDNVYGERELPDTFIGSFVDDPVNPDLATLRNVDLVEDNFNDSSYQGYRLSSKMNFDDNWELLVQHLNQDIVADGVFDYDPEVGDLQVQRFFQDEMRDSFNQTSWTLDGRLGMLDLVYTGAFLERDVDQKIDYSGYANVGPFIPYYICNYPSYTECAEPKLGFIGNVYNERTTNELRVSSNPDNKIFFTAGIFSDDTLIETLDDYYYPGTVTSGSVDNPFPQNAPISGSVMVNPNARDQGIAFFNDITRTEVQTAVFGEVSFKALNDLLMFTFGARSYDLEVDFAGSSNFLYRDYSGSEVPLDGDGGRNYDVPANADIPGHGTEPLTQSDTILKFTVSYKPNENTMLYATSSEGFRPGGFNRGGGAYSYNSEYPNVPVTYLSDDVVNNEIGAKTLLMDGKLRFNGSFYWIDWTDMQSTRFDPVNVSNLTFVENAADAEISGFEGDFIYLATDRLSFTGGFSLNNSELVRTKALIQELAPVGSQLPLTPEVQYFLRGVYDYDINNMPARLSIVNKYSGEAYSSIVADKRRKQDAYSIFDASLSIDLNENIMVEAFARNLTDERAELFFNEMDDVPRVTTNRPRNIGVRISYKF